MTAPPPDWPSPGFDASMWTTGVGGFGTTGTPGARIGTTWESPDIWLRGEFTIAALPSAPQLLLHHDEDAEVFINGVQAAQVTGYLSGYAVVSLSGAARAALHAGRNTIAVHAHNTRGGQFIDVGLIDVIER